jgi:type IV pilus assembly protein PilO
MNELVEKFLKLKLGARIGVVAGIAGVIGALYYVLFYTDLSEQSDQLRSQQNQLREERADYEKRKSEYLAYRNELLQLQEQQRELLRALPKKQEIASFIGSIQEQAELAGLEVLNLSPDAEVPQELYIKIPVKMEIRGGYHAITKFFKSVSELRRIVNVESLSLSPERSPLDPEGAPVKLKARFVAATFRYNDTPNAGGGT